MKFKINSKQLNYLKKTFSNDKSDLFDKLEITSTKRIFIELPDEIADEIRNWAIDKQTEVGFDADYKLTAEGEILQSLIDGFFVGQ